jgi:hypothetical protein
VLLWSLIGNPVETGDGPAAVTSLFSLAGKGELFRPLCATVLNFRDGKAAERVRESEDLPRLLDTAFEVRGCLVVLRIKKGNPRIESPLIRGFFCFRVGCRKGECKAMHLYWRIKEDLLVLCQEIPVLGEEEIGSKRVRLQP